MRVAWWGDWGAEERLGDCEVWWIAGMMVCGGVASAYGVVECWNDFVVEWRVTV